MKIYRRFIRVNNKIIASPKFSRKADAEHWYAEMLRQKHYKRRGLPAPAPADDIKLIEYCRKWMDEREKNYPPATYKADDQRLRDYILPVLGERYIKSIEAEDIKVFFQKISREGFRIKGEKISEQTKIRVKALLSVIFKSAINETPPVVTHNPVYGVNIRESGKRVGRKRPSYLESRDDCLKFLEAAKAIGEKEFAVCSILLMTGLRKQELIALRWSSVHWAEGFLSVSDKYEQASNSIRPGTKAGEQVVRDVPIPGELLEILKTWRKKTKHKNDDDFIIARADGRYHHARDISTMIETVRERAGIRVTVHGLRHTYGREFALNTGNLKALQAILGHSSSSTTDLYSELARGRLSGFRESVKFGVGVRKSEK